jgi:hypothetical protein
MAGIQFGQIVSFSLTEHTWELLVTSEVERKMILLGLAGNVGCLHVGQSKRVATGVDTSQDAKVDLKPLIVAIIPIYFLSETINVLFFLFLSIFNKLIIFSSS